MKRRKLIPEPEEEENVNIQKQEQISDEVLEKVDEASTVEANTVETSAMEPNNIVENEESSEETIEDEKEVVAEQEEHPSVRIIVEPSRRKTVSKAKVYIEGKLDINNAEYLAGRIKEIISTYNIIDFKLRSVEDFDLSSVQILYYFKELFNNEEKNISFHLEELPVALKTILVKTKYNKILFKKPINSTT